VVGWKGDLPQSRSDALTQVAIIHGGLQN
jgi:hypothetical protein